MKIFVKEKKLSLNKPAHHSLVEVSRHLASVILQLQAQRGPTFLRDESILPLIMALSSLPWYHHHYLSNHSGRAPLTRWKLSNFSFDLSRLNLQPRRNCFRICKVVISTRQHGKHRWEEEMVNCHYHSFWWMMCQNQNLVIPPDVPQVRALVDPLPKVCHAGRHLRFWFHFLDCMWRLVGQRQAKLNQIRFVRYSAKNSRLRFWFFMRDHPWQIWDQNQPFLQSLQSPGQPHLSIPPYSKCLACPASPVRVVVIILVNLFLNRQ